MYFKLNFKFTAAEALCSSVVRHYAHSSLSF